LRRWCRTESTGSTSRISSPYRPAFWSNDFEIGGADFYLTEDGEELLSSYLHGLPLEELYVDDTCERYKPRRQAWTRFVIIASNCPYKFFTPWGNLPVPEPEPAPQRIPRLIWIDDGIVPFEGWRDEE
jgi:hypothetical protein